MNGLPTCADPNLMNNVLRKQWAWDGFVVSDYDAYANILNTHHFTKDMEHAAAAGTARRSFAALQTLLSTNCQFQMLRALEGF
jgi:beta-glucosidase-like glycosyl hydrolase